MNSSERGPLRIPSRARPNRRPARSVYLLAALSLAGAAASPSAPARAGPPEFVGDLPVPAVTAPDTTVAAGQMVLIPRYTTQGHWRALSSPLLFTVWLLEDGTGWIGVDRREGPARRADAVAVSWTREEGTLRVEGRLPNLCGCDAWQWGRFSARIAASDGDDDGVPDTGTAEGSWSEMPGDVMQMTEFTAALAYGPDLTGPRARLVPTLGAPRGARPDALELEYDAPVEVRFSEPVAWPPGWTPEVRAGGDPVPGEADPFAVTEGFAVGFRFTPAAPLPFGEEVTLDVAGLYDPAGNRARWDRRALRVERFASLLENPGFEDGLEGWSGSGSPGVVGTAGGLPPARGERQLLVAMGGRLRGLLRVPGDADRLSFTAAVFGISPRLGAGISVRLEAPGRVPAVVHGSALSPREPVTEGEWAVGRFTFTHRAGPSPVTLDLTTFRGRIAALVVEVEGHPFHGPVSAVLLDDFRVVRRAAVGRERGTRGEGGRREPGATARRPDRGGP